MAVEHVVPSLYFLQCGFLLLFCFISLFLPFCVLSSFCFSRFSREITAEMPFEAYMFAKETNIKTVQASNDFRNKKGSKPLASRWGCLRTKDRGKK